MPSVPTGLYVFLGVSILVAAVFHWRAERYFVASLSSAVCAPILFLLATIVKNGWPLNTPAIRILYFAVSAFIVALLVGGLIRIARKLSARPS